jgi:hypothetical protein
MIYLLKYFFKRRKCSLVLVLIRWGGGDVDNSIPSPNKTPSSRGMLIKLCSVICTGNKLMLGGKISCKLSE